MIRVKKRMRYHRKVTSQENKKSILYFSLNSERNNYDILIISNTYFFIIIQQIYITFNIKFLYNFNNTSTIVTF